MLLLLMLASLLVNNLPLLLLLLTTVRMLGKMVLLSLSQLLNHLLKQQN